MTTTKTKQREQQMEKFPFQTVALSLVKNLASSGLSREQTADFFFASIILFFNGSLIESPLAPVTVERWSEAVDSLIQMDAEFEMQLEGFVINMTPRIAEQQGFLLGNVCSPAWPTYEAAVVGAGLIKYGDERQSVGYALLFLAAFHLEIIQRGPQSSMELTQDNKWRLLTCLKTADLAHPVALRNLLLRVASAVVDDLAQTPELASYFDIE